MKLTRTTEGSCAVTLLCRTRIKELLFKAFIKAPSKFSYGCNPEKLLSKLRECMCLPFACVYAHRFQRRHSQHEAAFVDASSAASKAPYCVPSIQLSILTAMSPASPLILCCVPLQLRANSISLFLPVQDILQIMLLCLIVLMYFSLLTFAIGLHLFHYGQQLLIAGLLPVYLLQLTE